MEKLNLSDKAGIIILGNIVNSVAGLLLGIVLVRVISKENYGTYRQVWLIFESLSSVLLLGIPSSILYFVPTLRENEQKSFIYQTILFLLFIGFIMGLVLFLASGFIADRFNNPRLAQFLKMISIFPILAMPIIYLQNFLIATDKHKIAAISQIILNLIIPITVAVVAILGYSLKLIFIWILIVSGIRLLGVQIFSSRMLSNVHSEMNLNLFKSQLKYCTPLGLSRVTGTLSGYLDRFIISSFFLPEKFAIYSVGAKEIPFVGMITYSVGQVIMPKLVTLFRENKKEEFIKLWHESIRKVALVILPIFVFLLIFAELVITLLFTKNYAESALPFRIYLCKLPLRVTAYGNIIRAMGFPQYIFIGSLIVLISNVILSILLVKTIGFLGPAIATVLVTYILTYYYLTKISKKCSRSLLEIFPWRNVLKIFAISLFCGFITYPAKLLHLPCFMKIGIGGIVFVTLYLSLLSKLNIITQSDRLLFKRWITLKVFFKSSKG